VFCIFPGDSADGFKVQFPSAVPVQPLKHKAGGRGGARGAEHADASQSVSK